MRTLLKARYLLLFALLFAIPVVAHAQVAVGVSITLAPPAMPVYEQPPCPTEGYLWTPGYWGYGTDGYYWTPGVWVAPPRVRFPLDARLLGIRGRPLRLARGLLGTARRILRRN